MQGSYAASYSATEHMHRHRVRCSKEVLVHSSGFSSCRAGNCVQALPLRADTSLLDHFSRMLSCSCCTPARQLHHARGTPRLQMTASACAGRGIQSSSIGNADERLSRIESGRRHVLLQGVAAVVAAVACQLQAPQPVFALPLAPLGDAQRIGGDKLIGKTPEQVKDILAKDLSEGMYFVTGNLTREIFADDCRFSDPTNDVTGLSKYVTALGILFDPDWSKVLLLDIRVTGPRTIEADWKLGGWLRSKYFPWQPKVDPFTGHTVYTLNDDGLIQQQQQTWSISGFKALQETFTPAPGPRVQLL